MDIDYEEINIVKEFKNLAMIDNSSRDERKVRLPYRAVKDAWL